MKERGIALISSILLGIALLLVGIGAASYILTGGRFHLQLSQREEVLNIADAGLEWAIAHFDPDVPTALATAAPFGQGVYEVATASVLAANQRYLVRVDAFIPTKENPRYHRAVQGIIQSSPAPVFNHALAAGGNVSLTGSIEVKSSPEPHAGHVHANGNIVATGGSLTVDGNTSAHGTDTLGGTSNAPMVEIPTMTSQKINNFYQQAVAARQTATFDPLSGGILQGYYAPASTWEPMAMSHSTFAPTGVLTIPAGSVVFIDGDLKLSGNTTIAGGGTIVVNGKVTITGNVSISQKGELSIVSTSNAEDAISISGNIKVGCLPSGATPPPGEDPSAIFFTPNGGITMSGNPSVYGSLVAGENGDVKGNATITRISTRTSGVQGFGSWRVINWRELK